MVPNALMEHSFLSDAVALILAAAAIAYPCKSLEPGENWGWWYVDELET